MMMTTRRKSTVHGGSQMSQPGNAEYEHSCYEFWERMAFCMMMMVMASSASRQS